MSEKTAREPMQKRIAYAQLSLKHPVLKENKYVQRQYFSLLKSYCSKLFSISKYSKAVLHYYKSFFHIERQSNCKRQLNTKLRDLVIQELILDLEAVFEGVAEAKRHTFQIHVRELQLLLDTRELVAVG